MREISAVSSRIPHREIHDGFEEPFAGSQRSGARALIELSNDGCARQRPP